MRQILFFAIAALVLAGVMPRVMGSVGNRPAPEAPQPVAKRAEPAPQTANYRTVTVRADRLGHFQVEGSVDGRRLDFMPRSALPLWIAASASSKVGHGSGS